MTHSVEQAENSRTFPAPAPRGRAPTGRQRWPRWARWAGGAAAGLWLLALAGVTLTLGRGEMIAHELGAPGGANDARLCVRATEQSDALETYVSGADWAFGLAATLTGAVLAALLVVSVQRAFGRVWRAVLLVEQWRERFPTQAA